MGTKPKARSTKKKVAKRSKAQAKEQSERFIKVARMLQSDETGKVFDKAFEKLVTSSKRRSKSDPIR